MTHIVIKLDHPPFEVTRESIENLPDWADFFYDVTIMSANIKGVGLVCWGHYLVSSRGKIEIWSPEDVERYIKNPYEECAKVAEVEQSCALSNHGHGKQIAQAIRQLEKECGK